MCMNSSSRKCGGDCSKCGKCGNCGGCGKNKAVKAKIVPDVSNIPKRIVDVVVAIQYSDEGKGKVVNSIVANQKVPYDMVIRANASTNASHEVMDENGNVLVAKQLPSVYFPEKTQLVIAPGAILNLTELRKELEQRPDISVLAGKVIVASSITLLIDAYVIATKKSAISVKRGSTNQGTGIAVVARTRKHALRLYDVQNYVEGKTSKKEILNQIEFTCLQTNKDMFEKIDKQYYEKILDTLVSDYNKIYNLVGDFSTDYTNYLFEKESAKILIEGCNGILIDNLHGVDRYTTSASTCVNALLNGANLSSYNLNNTYLVMGAYACCLDKRPFLTELENEKAAKVYEINSEVDCAEGKRRRIGWLDLVAIRRALVGQERGNIIINKMDVLSSFDQIKVCYAYLNSKGKVYYVLPDNIKDLEDCKPVYRTFNSWEDITGISEYEELPTQTKEYVDYVEQNLNMDSRFAVQVKYIGNGRKSSDMIEVK